MALFRKAIEMGYRAVSVYRTEDALDPLRARDDFRLLMMDLAMPAEPFARTRVPTADGLSRKGDRGRQPPVR